MPNFLFNGQRKGAARWDIFSVYLHRLSVRKRSEFSADIFHNRLTVSCGTTIVSVLWLPGSSSSIVTCFECRKPGTSADARNRKR